MFEEGGHLYVYFTYGMHFCANIVTGRKHIGEAVLIRAVEPIEGIDVMRKNRKFSNNHTDIKNLTNGPAKFCYGFGITKKYNGIDLFSDSFFIAEEQSQTQKFKIISSTRIGIKKGTEKKWRFFIEGNEFVSR